MSSSQWSKGQLPLWTSQDSWKELWENERQTVLGLHSNMCPFILQGIVYFYFLTGLFWKQRLLYELLLAVGLGDWFIVVCCTRTYSYSHLLMVYEVSRYDLNVVRKVCLFSKSLCSCICMRLYMYTHIHYHAKVWVNIIFI